MQGKDTDGGWRHELLWKVVSPTASHSGFPRFHGIKGGKHSAPTELGNSTGTAVPDTQLERESTLAP